MKNLHVIFFALVVFTGLFACSPSKNDHIEIAKSIIKRNLKDSDSAKFGNIHTVIEATDTAGTKVVHVCGFVNGRNSFNAYAGEVRFLVSLIDSGNQYTPTLSIAEIDDGNQKAVPHTINKEPATRFEQVYWNAYCLDSTHPATFTGIR